jgi:hypothetical protein
MFKISTLTELESHIVLLGLVILLILAGARLVIRDLYELKKEYRKLGRF